MSGSDESCLQYHYPTKEESDKYEISCVPRIYPHLNDPDKFNNKSFLEFIDKEFSTEAFKDKGVKLGPFEFSEEYKDKTNEQICSSEMSSLAPQQKFMGQLINPLTNFKGALIYHGLGSGKTCTSIVIGEAFKSTVISRSRLIYVVPAPLVDQYFNEIIGELRDGKLWSCSSFCVLKKEGKGMTRDYYSNDKSQKIHDRNLRAYNEKKNKLIELGKEIESGTLTRVEKTKKNKEFAKLENGLREDEVSISNDETTMKESVVKVFEIISHTRFINQLYKTGDKGKLIKNQRLNRVERDDFHGGARNATEHDLGDTVFSKDGILVIDEIQRLISASGIFYKKLYNAIKYYFHDKLRVILMSATPIYDNPYELALTINLLRPRIPFPINKKDFYKFFIGEKTGISNKAAIDSGKTIAEIKEMKKLNKDEEIRRAVKTANKEEKTKVQIKELIRKIELAADTRDKLEEQMCVPSKNPYITKDSCVINKHFIAYLCAGYVSYFKGGNPNAYPYKRVITLEHVMGEIQKKEYTSALESDLKKDKGFREGKGSGDRSKMREWEDDTPEKEDSVSGIYITTQQNSNISLPRINADENGNGELATTIEDKEKALQNFNKMLSSQKFAEDRSDGKTRPQRVIGYLRARGWSNKFAGILDESMKSEGPVFIFSNWLIYGVKSLAMLLDACGFVEFGKPSKPGTGKYFVWSSETKTRDNGEELIKAAKAAYNSPENEDGSVLKIILGTRSVMEGVSFKNVRQVHLTEPWWNEARIEQIMARGSRYCSHSKLMSDKQHIDVFRHYSVYPGVGESDEDTLDMMSRNNHPEGYNNFEKNTIDQKMTMTAKNKEHVNDEINQVLKMAAIDVSLNKNGNLVRLEEYIEPLLNGKMQIYFRNSSNGIKYIREGIPIDGVVMEEVYARKYSFPNDKELPVMFYSADYNTGVGYLTRLTGDEEETLTEKDMDHSLIVEEEITPWDDPRTFKEFEAENKHLFTHLNELGKKYRLIPILRKEYLKEEHIDEETTGGIDKIKFTYDPDSIQRLETCVKKLSTSSDVSKTTKGKIILNFMSTDKKDEVSLIVDDIIKSGIYSEDWRTDLFQQGMEDIDEIRELRDFGMKEKTAAAARKTKFGLGAKRVAGGLMTPTGKTSIAVNMKRDTKKRTGSKALGVASADLNPGQVPDENGIRRLIICRGGTDPNVDDDDWRDVETLDSDPNKIPTYVASIDQPFPPALIGIGQFDEIMLKYCNMYTLFDNLPEQVDDQGEPLFAEPPEPPEDMGTMFDVFRGEIDLEPNHQAWNNISRLLKDGGKLYHSGINKVYVNYSTDVVNPGLVDAINEVIAPVEFEEVFDGAGDSDEYIVDGEVFEVYVKHAN